MKEFCAIDLRIRCIFKDLIPEDNLEDFIDSVSCSIQHHTHKIIHSEVNHYEAIRPK